MGHTKTAHIDWLNAQDDVVVAPVEGHDGYRVDSRELQEHDFASDVDEDCGWFGYEGLCED
jgi:chitinase